MAVKVEFDAFPGSPVPATIKDIGTEASSSTRTYPVTLALEQPTDQKILPGMAGRAFGEPPGSDEICGICFWQDDNV